MPVSRKDPSAAMSQENVRLLAVALGEMKSRGMSTPSLTNLRGKTHSWTIDPYGYFIKQDGKIFTANEKQASFISSTSRFSLLGGGRGSGKTGSGAQKAMRKIMQGESGSVLNPDFENFKYSTWPEFREWIDWNMVVPSQRYRNNSEWSPHQPFTMVFLNGAKAFCKGLKDPDSARGPNINWLWYDEGARDKTGMGWKLATAGVRVGKDPQAWITTTPKGKDHWMYKFFVLKEIPKEALDALEAAYGSGTSMVEYWFTSIDDNKDNLDPGFYAQMLATYPTGWLRDQELKGLFCDEGGVLGDRAWFYGKILTAQPDNPSHRLRYWDLAASEKKITGKYKSDDPDSTVGTRLSLDKGRYVIEHQVSTQALYHDIVRLMMQTAEMDGKQVPIYIEQEPGAGGKNQVAAIAGMPEFAGYTVIAHNPRDMGDKVMRAMPWFSKAATGIVYMLAGEWNESFLDQLASFPGGMHDDKIDSVSGCFGCIEAKQKWKDIKFLSIGKAEK